jgi:hypothetical protein
MNNSVDFFTFCCPKDIVRLAQPGELTNRVLSHGFPFASVNVIRQRCANDFDDIVFSSDRFSVTEYRSEDFPDILKRFHVEENNPLADELTHGPSGPHYWRNHVTNHLTALVISKADYIVFSDCDCRIEHQVSSWVNTGIDILKHYKDVLIVCPSDGGDMAEKRYGNIRLTQNVSQQLFLCERRRFMHIDFDAPWNGVMDAPGGPFQEYYFLMEGRIWRWLRAHGLYRALLSSEFRYWHDQWH